MKEDGFSAAALRLELDVKCIGSRIHHYRQLSSTMDRARQLANMGTPEGTVVIAEEQGMGRGRLGRQWLAPAGGNVYLSVVLYPNVRTLPQLVMLSSLAVCHALDRSLPTEASIKWPNDILVNGKKVSGTLIESTHQGGVPLYAVVGIGINVSFDPRYIDTLSTAGSGLSVEANYRISRLTLVADVLKEMDYLYNVIHNGTSLISQWRQRLATLGRRVNANDGDSHIAGIAEDVDCDGNLVIRTHDGQLISLLGGDVSLR